MNFTNIIGQICFVQRSFDIPETHPLPRPGIEQGTFRSSVWRSPNWAIAAWNQWFPKLYRTFVCGHLELGVLGVFFWFILLPSFSIWDSSSELPSVGHISGVSLIEKKQTQSILDCEVTMKHRLRYAVCKPWTEAQWTSCHRCDPGSIPGWRRCRLKEMEHSFFLLLPVKSQKRRLGLWKCMAEGAWLISF